MVGEAVGLGLCLLLWVTSPSETKIALIALGLNPHIRLRLIAEPSEIGL
jgi:hypothetical protein